MKNYVYCEPCRAIHTPDTRCEREYAWITLGEFPSRHEALRKARWYGYTIWKSA